jgi:hypothetical protein
MNLKLLLFILTFLSPLSLRGQTPAAATASQPMSPMRDEKIAAARANPVLPPEKMQPTRLSRFEQPPSIDGKLDEQVWKSAAVLKDFYQIQPGDNIPPSQPTEVLLGYDAKNLYIGFRARDEQSKVRATVARRDGIFADDYVGIYLDTYHDKRKAYALYFNPLGIQADSIMTEGRGEDFSVDIVMESKGVVIETGFTVEVAIPFKSLRYEVGKDKLWGVHAVRAIKRFNDEQDSWMPISRDRSGWLNQAGQLTGLEGVDEGRTLEIIPSMTFSETGARVRSLPRSVIAATPGLTDPGRFVNKPMEADPGVTMKLGITPTVTLDFALNPDFAQVEADQTVVTANQRFPIFFEEKRPFFLEGIDIFQTSLTPVHTRAIVDPDVAVKLTGKTGRNTFGLLVASDRAPGNYSPEERNDPSIRPGIERFLDKNATIGVLRLKRDVGKESTLGLIATTYNFIEKHNHLGGFDGRIRLDQKTVFNFQVLGTTSRRFFFDPQAGRSIYRTGNALGYSYGYSKSGRHLSYSFSGQGRTRDYRADVGFTRRQNTNFEEFFINYTSEPKPKAKFVSWNIFNASGTNFDWQGRMQNWSNETQIGFNFRRQTYFKIGFTGGYERLFEEEFGPVRTRTRAGTFAGNDSERSTYKKNLFVYGGTTPSKKYSAFLLVGRRSGEFDFDFGAGRRYPRVSPAALIDPDAPLDPGPGSSLNINASFTYQPTKAMRNTFSYNKVRLVRYDTGLTAFDENIYVVRSTYQFTRFTFVRARIDYATLASRIRGQFLLGWAPNPGTAFYAGYNDDLNRNGFSPFTGHLEPGFRRNGRTFFIKMSYLFRRSM